MTDFPHAWARLAWEEGHRPHHLKDAGNRRQKDAGGSKRRAGETAAALRELAARGVYLSEAARILGVTPSTIQSVAKSNGITLRRSTGMEGRRNGKSS